MNNFNFKKIDAFATAKSAGNPAGFVQLESPDKISSRQMQQIATEMKGFVNEVGFLSQLDDETFWLKYYSSEKEVQFCGHATVAIMYEVLKNNPDLRSKEQVYVVNNTGKLRIENRIETEDSVFITAPSAQYRETIFNHGSISDWMDETVISENLPVRIIDAGLRTLLIPIKSLNELLNIAPDFELVKKFLITNDLDIIEVFTHEVIDSTNSYRVRVFAPPFGYLEDPATGSGNSALGYYLINEKLWDGEIINIEQNQFMYNFNVVKIKTYLDACGMCRVAFGGKAVKRLEGIYYLQ